MFVIKFESLDLVLQSLDCISSHNLLQLRNCFTVCMSIVRNRWLCLLNILWILNLFDMLFSYLLLLVNKWSIAYILIVFDNITIKQVKKKNIKYSCIYYKCNIKPIHFNSIPNVLYCSVLLLYILQAFFLLTCL